MRVYRCEKDIIQNLKDAGCDEATIQIFMKDLECGRHMDGTQLLEAHRRSLLDQLHQNQRQIDCLDYLLFMLKKEKESQIHINKTF